MASIRARQGIGALLQGLALGMESRERSRLLEQREARQRAVEDRIAREFALREAALAGLPENLGVLSRAIAGQPGIPPGPGFGAGEEAGAPLAALAGFPAEPRPPLVGAVPGARTTAELLGRPEAAQAFSGLLRAGVQPFSVVKPPEVARKEIESEERERRGRERVSSALPMLSDKDPAKRMQGIAQMYQGAVDLGQLPNVGSFLQFVQNEQDRVATEQDLATFGPALGKAMGGTLAPEERMGLLDGVLRAKSPFFRSLQGDIAKSVIGQLTGPDSPALRRYAELVQANPSREALEVWRQVERELPLPASLAVTKKTAPSSVLSALGVEQKKAEAKATEEGRRAAVPESERKLKEDLLAARAEAARRLRDLRSGKLQPKDAILAAQRMLDLTQDYEFAEGVSREDAKEFRDQTMFVVRDIIGELAKQRGLKKEDLPKPPPDVGTNPKAASGYLSQLLNAFGIGQRPAQAEPGAAAPASKPGQLPTANTPPGGREPTEAEAVAEAQRLIAAGHSKESAVQAMRQSGWNVTYRGK